MAFRTFDRKVFFKLEASEGTYQEPSANTDFIECIDPSWTITNRSFERNPTRMSVTPVPMIVPGTSKTAPSGTIEISFSVELAGGGALATAPRWGDLLLACGMREITAITTVPLTAITAGSGPKVMRNYENIDMANATSYSGGSDKVGRVIGDTFTGESVLHMIRDGSSVSFTASDKVIGQVSDNYFTGAALSAAQAIGYVLTSGTELGGGNSSSLTFEIGLDNSNSKLQAVGCRGNVEFAFVSGDAVRMNFTFTGRLKGYVESGTVVPEAQGRPIPPAFVGVDMTIQQSDYGGSDTDSAAVADQIFNSMTINLGNEVTVRENVEVATGYDAAYITGRTPTMTFNPDAVKTATYDYWQRLLAGETNRVSMQVGTAGSGNSFLFKMPAAQFSGIADGSRDEVVVYDGTCTLTGGDYGSSVQEITGADSTVTNARLGTNNEFCFFQN